jgi:thioredoxin-like negative regulator of GroEL
MINDLDTPAAFDAFLRAHPAAAVYFGSADCGVCHALWPKLVALCDEQFAHLALARVDIELAPALAARQGVFTVPVVVVYFEGKEWVRKAGAFAPAALAQEIARPYTLLFGEASP